MTNPEFSGDKGIGRMAVDLRGWEWEIEDPTFIVEYWAPTEQFSADNPAYASRAIELGPLGVREALETSDSLARTGESWVLYVAVECANEGKGLVRLVGRPPTEAM